MKKQRGSGLIFAVILLFVILGMVITLSSITVLETKMSQKTKSSVGAFYNSESGVEWALNKIANSPGDAAISTIGNCPFTGCGVLFLDQDGNVLAASAAIDQVKAVRSVGSQISGGTTQQRAIEAAVAAENGKYSLSCFVNQYGAYCCRMKTETGEAVCKTTSGSGWVDWGPGGSHTGSSINAYPNW